MRKLKHFSQLETENDFKINPADPKEDRIENQASAKRSEYGIWIGNLPWSATKDSLRQFLTTNTNIADGKITRIHIPMSIDSKGSAARKNKGFAYVDLSTQAALAEALDLSEALVGGRRVLIKDAKSFEGRPKKSQDELDSSVDSGKPPSRRIFIGNLDFDTTKDDVEGHFSQCGKVLGVQVATFEDSGKCKGYGWVDFESIEASQAAVRGWVNMEQKPEDSDQGESEQDQAKLKPMKNRTQRKWWVNKLHGRQLRTEFGEDKAVRYKKRFGKSAMAQKGTKIINDTDASSAEALTVDKPATKTDEPKKSLPDRTGPVHTQQKKRFDARQIKPGAALAAAPRLQGSIVASQGRKTMVA